MALLGQWFCKCSAFLSFILPFCLFHISVCGVNRAKKSTCSYLPKLDEDRLGKCSDTLRVVVIRGGRHTRWPYGSQQFYGMFEWVDIENDCASNGTWELSGTLLRGTIKEQTAANDKGGPCATAAPSLVMLVCHWFACGVPSVPFPVNQLFGTEQLSDLLLQWRLAHARKSARVNFSWHEKEQALLVLHYMVVRMWNK